MKKKLLAGLISVTIAGSMLLGCSLPININIGNSGVEDEDDGKDSDKDENSDGDKDPEGDSGKTDDTNGAGNGEGNNGEDNGENNGTDIGNAEVNSGFSNIRLSYTRQYVTGYHNEVSDMVYYGEYPVFELEDDFKEQYPKLQMALDKLAQSYSSSLAESYNYGMETINDMLEDGYYLGGFFDVRRDAVRRADEKVLSILDLYGGYAGGAHESYYYKSSNFNPETGRKLYIDDVVTDISGLSDAVNVALAKYYGNIDINTEVVDSYFSNEHIDEIVWTLDYNGITIYFNPYWLSSYSDGEQVVTITVKEYPELFDSSYFAEGDFDYVVEMLNSTPLYVDLEGNGSLDKVVNNAYIEEGDYMDYYMYQSYTYNNAASDFDIIINDKVSHFDVYASATECYYVHNSGKDYMYVFCREETRDKTLVCELGENNAKKIVTDSGVYLEEYTSYIGDDYVYFKYKMTDTDYVRIYKNSVLLSWFTDSWIMYVGDDGILKSYDEFLYNTQDYSNMEDYAYIPYEYTVLQQMDIDVVDEAGNYTGEVVTLYPDDKVRMYRTDTKSIVDLTLPNGKIGRLVFDDQLMFGDGCSSFDYFGNIFMD